MNEEPKELRKALGIDDWLELVKEDKNLNGAYISFGQYMYILEKQNAELKERYNNMFKCHCNRVEVEKLQSNWNELKKWVEEIYNEENKYNFCTEDFAYNQVLCYMQELEQGKDENN